MPVRLTRTARRHFRMSAFDQVFEVVTSITFLIVGLWGTAFGYGWVGTKMVGGLHWSLKFQRPLRWLGRYRRLSRDYERQATTGVTMVYLAMIRLMLARLGRP